MLVLTEHQDPLHRLVKLAVEAVVGDRCLLDGARVFKAGLSMLRYEAIQFNLGLVVVLPTL